MIPLNSRKVKPLALLGLFGESDSKSLDITMSSSTTVTFKVISSDFNTNKSKKSFGMILDHLKNACGDNAVFSGLVLN